MRRWQLLLAVTLVSLMSTPVAEAAVSPEEPGAIVSGLLVDAAGHPVAGAVELFAWPTGRPVDVGQTVQLTRVGYGRAASDGRFSVQADLTPELADLADLNGGYVNFVLQAVRSGIIEEQHFSRYVGDARFTAQGTSSPGRSTEWQAAPDEPAQPVRITLGESREGGTTPGDRPISPMQGGCWGMKLVESHIGQTVIGELRAPLDTEEATFVYGQRADSEIGVAMRGSKGPWTLSGSFQIANAQEGEITQRARSGEHLLIRSRFVYDRYEYVCGTGKRERVVPREWMGDVQAEPTAVRGCARAIEDNLGHYGPGGGFARVKERAVRWDGAVDAFGASLTARSGYSKYVRSRWVFGFAPDHALCGDNGKPADAGHIFAGTSA